MEIHDDVVSTINKIKNINDDGIDLIIPEGSVLFENILNLKLIEQQAEKYGVSVQFTTKDEAGNTLISALEGSVETTFESGEEKNTTETTYPNQTKRVVALPKLPRINLGNKTGIIIGAVVVATILLFMFLSAKSIKANVEIILANLPLTRSIPVKVKLDTPTNPSNNLLKGTSVETTIQGSMEADTTGTKLVGEKSGGKVKLFNKTDESITLDKGTLLTYKSSGSEYKFSIDDDMTIDAQVAGSSADSNVYGEASITVTATDIGSSYNIDKNKTLEVAKYKSTKLAAKSTETFKGGKSSTVKVVSLDDQKNLSQKLMAQNVQGAEIALRARLKSPLKLISGATKAMVAKETYNYKVDDKTDKLSLDQTITASGLAYSDTELNSLMNKVIDKYIPSGYYLSKNDWSESVAVLGNSTNSVLSVTESDLQVSVKTSVVPSINQDEIKKQLAGKTIGDAQKYLGGIRNIKNYKLNVRPAIPFFRKVPNDITRIDLVIQNE